MPQMQHGRYARHAWLNLHVMNGLANCLFFHLFTIFHDLLLDEIAKCGDAFRLAQFLGVGEEYGHFTRMDIGQDAHQVGKIAREVIRQNTDAEIVQNTLQNTEVIVHGQE